MSHEMLEARSFPWMLTVSGDGNGDLEHWRLGSEGWTLHYCISSVLSQASNSL